MHITLYRKYRSKDFDDVAGQEEIVKGIRNSLKSDKLAHALLFSGPRGVGKTSIARLIAKGINCLTNGVTDNPCNTCENCVGINEGTFMDMVEIDAASNRGIDEIRELKDKINYKPSKGRKKIYIIDEVHMLTKEAFNALLKTLEEPPEHAIFILATTEPEKILPTIISRCQRYDFKVIPFKNMKERLLYIAKEEKMDIEDEVFPLIYETSGGGMRDAISILERVHINFYGEKLTRESVEKILGITPQNKINIFISEIKEKNREKLIELLEEMWIESNDIEMFFKDLGKTVRDSIQKKEMEISLGLKIIGVIYDVISKFKFEEDKRLLGYVIIDELLNHLEPQVIVKEVKEIVKVESPEIRTSEERSSNTKKSHGGRVVTFREIEENWELAKKNLKTRKISLIAFLIHARPKGIENNELIVEFSRENAFSEQQMKKPANNEIFQEVFSEILGADIRIKYELKNSAASKSKREIDEDFTEKIAEFFGGTIVDN